MLALCREIANSAEALLGKLGEGGKEKLAANAVGHKSIRADIALEDMVIGKLRKKAKVLVTEERGEVGLAGEDIVVCDPLDGSRNYRLGISAYCIALAFSKSRRYEDIYFSYVKDLASGNEFWADEKCAYRNGKKICASEKTELGKCIVEIDARESSEWKTLISLLSSVRDHRRVGANALALCYLANGGLDAFLDLRGTLSVVHIAGVHIAEKAGACITDAEGGKLSPELKISSSFSFIGAGNRQLHKKILGMLK